MYDNNTYVPSPPNKHSIGSTKTPQPITQTAGTCVSNIMIICLNFNHSNHTFFFKKKGNSRYKGLCVTGIPIILKAPASYS